MQFFCKVVILKSLVLFVSQITFSQNLYPIPDSTYHKYEGNYLFDDGKFITGGLMDEIEGHQVFIEPLNIATGGLFKPVDSVSFQSYPPDNITIKYELNSDGSVKGLWWNESGKDTLFAEKISDYEIKEVEFENDDIKLAGELRLPKGPGPYPVIINVHGSGKQTRHMGPWNTLFPKYGIAVLSYDKRGCGESTGKFAISGYKDFASDVLAAVDYLKHIPEIDSTKIGLHGSSEGGWVSSITATKTDDVSFMIIRAGSGVSGSENYLYEVKNELQNRELMKDEIDEVLTFERTIQNMAAEQKSLREVNSYIDNHRNRAWFPKIYDDWKGVSQNRLIQMQKTGPIDPVDYLSKISQLPVLWFLAENDENVPYEISKQNIEKSLKQAGNNDFEIVSLPGADHAFFINTKDGKRKYTDGYWNKMIFWLEENKIVSE